MNTKIGHLLSALLLLFIYSGTANSAPLSNQPYDVLLDGVKTPHIPLANPFVAGKIKALVIAPTWSQRETIELAQRLSLDYQAIMTHSYAGYDQGIGGYMFVSPEIVRNTTDERIKGKFDAIIIGKMDWKILPSNIRLEILRKVYNGTGLVYICPPQDNPELTKLFSGEKHYTDNLLPGVDITGWPAFYGLGRDSIVKLSRFGRGTVAVLDFPEKEKSAYQSLTPSAGGYNQSGFYYDLYQMLLANLTIQVSHKHSDMLISDFKVRPTDVDIRLHRIWKTAPNNQNKNPDIEIRVYDSSSLEYTRIIHSKAFNAEEQKVKIRLPALKDGLHFVFARLLYKGKVADFTGDTLNIDHSARINQIKFDRDILGKTDSISGKIESEGFSASDQIEIKLWDAHGRLLAKKTVPAVDKVYFSFPVSSSLSCINKIQASMYSKSTLISQKTAEFTIRQSYDPYDFSMIMWLMEIPEDDYLLSRVYMNRLYKSGVDTVYEYSTVRLPEDRLNKEVRMLSYANLRIIPYCWRIFPYEGVKDNIRKPSLTDPAYRKDVDKQLTWQAKIFHRYSVDSYSLGDENILAEGEADVCFSESSLAGFREYLKNIYGSLSVLNTEWKSSYTDWSQIVPLTAPQARETGRYAQWLDFRMYMDSVYTDINLYAQSIIRKVEPKARVGAEGFYDTTSWAGYNWPQLLKSTQLCGLYANLHQKEVLRSFINRDSVTGTWYGTYTGALFEAGMRYHPWDSLFHRQNSAFWYAACHSVGAGGGSIFTPDFTPIPAYSQTMEEINEIKHGPGKLLLTSEQESDGIALLYSQPSLHMSSLLPGPTTQKRSWEEFISALESSYYQYKFISAEQLVRGDLKRFKVLILPYAQALSAGEANTILEFAKAGGLVIADYPAGLYDEHGINVTSNPLDRLINTSAAMSEVAYGKGKGIYIGGYASLADNLHKVLIGNNVAAGVRLGGIDGKSPIITHISVCKLGSNRYICMLPTTGARDKKDCLLFVGSRSYLYDVRAKKFLGFSDRIKITLTPGIAKIIAACPSRTTGISIKTVESIRKGQNLSAVIKVNAGKDASDKIVRLSVKDPRGSEIREYSRNLTAIRGFCDISIPFAMNDATGTWKVKVTDITSGVSDEKIVRIH